MTDLHYFPLLAGDWLAGEAVSMMTPEQEGAFIHLLCYAWQSSGVPCSLPNDDATLAHLSRLGKRWEKVGAFVKAQFDVMADDPTRLRNAKLWAIYSDASVKHARRVNAGRTGGIAKAERKQPASNASPMLEHSPSKPASNALAKASNQNQNQNQSQKEQLPTPRTAAADEVFDAAWCKYPKRAGGNSRADALKAFRARLAAGVPPAELIAGTERYAAYVRTIGKEGSEFVKQGSTFYGPSEHWKEPWDAPPPTRPKTKTIMVIENGWYRDVEVPA